MFFELNGQINTTLCCALPFLFIGICSLQFIHSFIRAQIHSNMGIELIKMTQHGRFHLYPNFPMMNYRASLRAMDTNVFEMRTWKRIILSNDLHSTQNDRFEKWSQCRRRPPAPQTRESKQNHQLTEKYRSFNAHIYRFRFDQIWRFTRMKNDWLNLSFHFTIIASFFSLSGLRLIRLHVIYC